MSVKIDSSDIELILNGQSVSYNETYVVKTKTCTKCTEIKPATKEFFSPHKSCKGGLQARCKECVKAAKKLINQARLNGTHPYIVKVEKKCPRCTNTLPANIQYFYSATHNPDALSSWCIGCVSEYERERVENRRQGVIPYVHKTEKFCGMCMSTKPVDEFHKNTGTSDGMYAYCSGCCSARDRFRRANQHLSDKLTASDYDLILQAYDYTCAYCPADLLNLPEGVKLHWDHALPLSRGGETTYENMTPSCSRCNMKKHTKTAEEFIRAVPT